MTSALTERPTVGKLTVPFVVDEKQQPIDFKQLDMERVGQCARQTRCAVCGDKIKRGLFAFIGPNDRRRCFADPWMHPRCARLAMEQCPFLGGRDWRDDQSRSSPFLQTYRHGNMTLFFATGGRAHRDVKNDWHFEVIGIMWPAGME